MTTVQQMLTLGQFFHRTLLAKNAFFLEIAIFFRNKGNYSKMEEKKSNIVQNYVRINMLKELILYRGKRTKSNLKSGFFLKF